MKNKEIFGGKINIFTAEDARKAASDCSEKRKTLKSIFGMIELAAEEHSLYEIEYDVKIEFVEDIKLQLIMNGYEVQMIDSDEEKGCLYINWMK